MLGLRSQSPWFVERVYPSAAVLAAAVQARGGAGQMDKRFFLIPALDLQAQAERLLNLPGWSITANTSVEDAQNWLRICLATVRFYYRPVTEAAFHNWDAEVLASRAIWKHDDTISNNDKVS